MPGALQSTTTILVADDHAVIREGIKQMITSLLGSLTFLEACDAAGVFRALGMHRAVRLAVLDLRMPGMDDGARLFELARTHPHVPVLVITALTSPDIVERTMRIPNVHAVVTKSASLEKTRRALEVVLSGHKLLDTTALREWPRTASELTPRQMEIRSLLRQGMSNKVIASTLGISEGTVKNHVTDILRALNARNRTQAAGHDLEPI